MTFTQAVRSVLSSYATFSGRSRRSEYWWFYLFTILVSFLTGIVDALLGIFLDNGIGIVGVVTSLALLLPGLAVTARRLHDTGRSGWWMLLPVVPVVLVLATVVAAITAAFSGDTGPAEGTVGVALVVLVLLTLVAVVTLLVFLCLDSEPGDNKYGPSPKPPAMPGWPGGAYPPPGYGPPSGQPEPPAPGFAAPQ